MAESNSYPKAMFYLFMRGIAGFAAGWIVSWFALTFLGMLQDFYNLTANSIHRQHQAEWIQFYIACGSAVFSMLLGKIQVPKYCLWFCIAFAVICVIPFWPHKGGGFLLPYGTPYVNFGFHTRDAILLIVHISIAAVVPAIIQWLWPIVQHRRKALLNKS